MKLTRFCPICGNDSGELLHNTRFAKGKQEFYPSECSVFSCYRCGFVFSDTGWDQSDYDRHYSKESKYLGRTDVTGWGGIYDSEIKRYERQIGRFEKYIPSRDVSIADIGCAGGGLLMSLQKMGYKNLFGIDPSEDCIAHLREFGIVGHRGILPEMGDIESCQFDVVVLSHVLEHIYDLPSAVEAIARIIKDDGLLYVEVPDAERYDESFQAPYHCFYFDHINHFSKDYLSLFFGEHFERINTSACDEIPYNACYGVFKKTSRKKVKTDIPISYSQNISKYLLKSLQTSDAIFQQVNALDWGGGIFEGSRNLSSSAA